MGGRKKKRCGGLIFLHPYARRRGKDARPDVGSYKRFLRRTPHTEKKKGGGGKKESPGYRSEGKKPSLSSCKKRRAERERKKKGQLNSALLFIRAVKKGKLDGNHIKFGLQAMGAAQLEGGGEKKKTTDDY